MFFAAGVPVTRAAPHLNNLLHHLLHWHLLLDLQGTTAQRLRAYVCVCSEWQAVFETKLHEGHGISAAVVLNSAQQTAAVAV
jgi:hypothetical protein